MEESAPGLHQQFYCPYCGAKVTRGAKFCPTCRRTFVDPLATTPHQHIVPTESDRRNPSLAAVLSLVCVGLGQFYNGETTKGAAFIALFFAVPFVVQASFPFSLLFVLPLIPIVAAYDAFTNSKKINLREKTFHKKSVLFWPEVIAATLLVVAGVVIAVSPITAAHSASFAAGALAGTNYPQYSLPLYDAALTFAPDDTGILMEKAGTLRSIGRTNEAQTNLDRVLKINPNETAPVIMKGDILFDNGQYQESIGYFEKALSINRNNAQVWIRKGDANLAISIIEMEQIRKQYRNLTSDYQKPSAANDASTMDAFRSTESYQEAVKDYNEAIRIDPLTSVEISGRILSSTQTLLTTYQGILEDINPDNVSANSGNTT